MQRLQTIVATHNADPILRSLPHDLHPYIYSFIQDEVKIHYLMEKYNWHNILDQLRDYYNDFHLIISYFNHVTILTSTKADMLYEMGMYREKDKFRDANGNIIRIEWTWNDDNCNYDAIFTGFVETMNTQYRERRDIHGLYTYFRYLLSLLHRAHNNRIDHDE